jgi:RNA polymerase sigma factor (sigma-70 family)
MEDQEDIIQDTMLGVCREARKPGFYLRQSFRALVRLVVKRRCIDFIRGQIERPRREAPLDDQLPASTPSPEDEYLRTEMTAQVRAALGQLNTRNRLIMIWRYRNGDPVKQIAQRLGISVGATKKHLFVNRLRLREVLRTTQAT